MAEKLSLDEILAIGRRVENWEHENRYIIEYEYKDRYTLDRCSEHRGYCGTIGYTGSIKGVDLYTERRCYDPPWSTPSGSWPNYVVMRQYVVLASSGNLELARYWELSWESTPGKIGNFYDSVCQKEEHTRKQKEESALQRARDLLR